MRFITITLIVHAPNPLTGQQKSTADRFGEVLDKALLAQELGFDGFAVGVRRDIPDPPWGWNGGPIRDDAVLPSHASATASAWGSTPAAVAAAATTA